MNIKTGPARELIDLSELLKWQAKGTIVTDDRRRRPLWFDGRFLDAQALNAEQNYFLARQSDFGRVAGFGVITGLGVTAHPTKARTITVEPGHGITPSGNQVVLPNRLTVDLAAVAEIQRLDASFGISAIPKASPFNRTGLFIVALRTVEYTGNPISSYPTSVDAPRTTHDGSMIEATAVSLIPYPDAGAGTELVQRRKAVAREIFFDESKKGQPENVLPLAMLALDHGVIKWLDVFMVRREIGLRERNVWGLGISPRPLRAAHLRQYDVHLQSLQASLGSNARIIAAEHFSVLPPTGPMPVGGINGTDFTQNFFPAEMDVEFSIVPEDELPALIEDSMLLPPLDLALSGEAQESTSVMVVMPVERYRFRGLSQSLPTLTRELAPAQPGMIAKRKPITALNLLMARRLPAIIQPEVVSSDSVWRAELSKQNQLWYLRRRNLEYKAEVTSWAVAMKAEETATDALVTERIAGLNLKTRFNALISRATSSGAAELTAFMASPLILKGNDSVVKAAVAELEKADSLDSLTVMKATEKFTDPAFGAGLSRITSSDALAGNTRVVDNVAKSGLLPQLDLLSRTLPAAEVAALTKELVEAGSGNDAAAVERVAKVIEEKAATANVVAPPSGPVVSKPLSSGLRVASGLLRSTVKPNG
jgi:hypothetical protein